MKVSDRITADSYTTKLFSPKELLSTIGKLLTPSDSAYGTWPQVSRSGRVHLPEHESKVSVRRSGLMLSVAEHSRSQSCSCFPRIIFSMGGVP
jgi:DNA-binding response OmpR family regulator